MSSQKLRNQLWESHRKDNRLFDAKLSKEEENKRKAAWLDQNWSGLTKLGKFAQEQLDYLKKPDGQVAEARREFSYLIRCPSPYPLQLIISVPILDEEYDKAEAGDKDFIEFMRHLAPLAEG